MFELLTQHNTLLSNNLISELNKDSSILKEISVLQEQTEKVIIKFNLFFIVLIFWRWINVITEFLQIICSLVSKFSSDSEVNVLELLQLFLIIHAQQCL